MLKLIGVVAASALLAACATQTLEQSYQAPLVDPMNNGLAYFKDKPAKIAFGLLNYPDEQKIIADRKAYIWTRGQGDCVIRLFVDETDVVRNGDWRGSVIGCSDYIQRMRAIR